MKDKPRAAALADKCNTTPVYLYHIANGYRLASHELARLLDEHSDGEVPKHETRPDIWESPSNELRSA